MSIYAKYHIHCNTIRIFRYITSLWAGSRPSLQMMATLVRELQVLLQVARCCRMQSAGRGASALVMITADLLTAGLGEMLLLLQCSSAADVIIIMIVQGAITLHSDLKYENEVKSSRAIEPFLFLLEIICGMV